MNVLKSRGSQTGQCGTLDRTSKGAKNISKVQVEEY